VYNEQIHDLLQKSSKSDGTKVKTDILYPRWSKSSKEIFDALTLGSTQRTQHPTDVNASSSRSHAIFQIVIKQRERSASDNAVVCSSMEAKMNLIDLAGSENVNAANTHGIEAGKINLSLLALAEVINALSNPLRSFVPYRNSKLTWLLKDSLGGNCRTIMIINISPSSLSYEATLNTLQYAKKAKGITSTLKSNIGSTDSIGEHPFMFAQTAAVVLPDCKTSVYTNAQIKSMPNILHNTFTALRQRRKDILLCEMDYKKCQLKMMDSEERFQRHKSIGNHEAEKVTLYAQHVIRMELEALEREINTKQRSFQEVDNWINKLEHEFTLLVEPGQKLKKKLKWHRLNMQLTDLQEQCEHIKYLYHLKEKEHKLTCKLVHSLLAAHHRQCQTLKAAGLPVDADQEKLLGYLVQRDEDDEEVECDTSLLEFSHITLDQSTSS
ncbi:kinesin-like protein KIF18A, partial [Clarias magur]